MTDISRQQCTTITRQIQDAIAPILKEHGLEVGKVRSKYGYKYSFSIEATILEEGEGGVNLNSDEASGWRMMAEFPIWPKGQAITPQNTVVLDPEAVGRTVEYQGKTLRLLGWRTKARTRPILFQVEGTDKQLIFSEDALRHPSFRPLTKGTQAEVEAAAEKAGK